MNLHAAYLHVMGDLAQSVAVFLGGIVIYWKPEYHIVDPILTLGFSALVLCSTVGVLRTSVAVLLEETPANIDWKEVYDSISALPNIHDVHDLRKFFVFVLRMFIFFVCKINTLTCHYLVVLILFPLVIF